MEASEPQSMKLKNVFPSDVVMMARCKPSNRGIQC